MQLPLKLKPTLSPDGAWFNCQWWREVKLSLRQHALHLLLPLLLRFPSLRHRLLRLVGARATRLLVRVDAPDNRELRWPVVVAWVHESARVVGDRGGSTLEDVYSAVQPEQERWVPSRGEIPVRPFELRVEFRRGTGTERGFPRWRRLWRISELLRPLRCGFSFQVRFDGLRTRRRRFWRRIIKIEKGLRDCKRDIIFVFIKRI